MFNFDQIDEIGQIVLLTNRSQYVSVDKSLAVRFIVFCNA